ncbi:Endonuclease, Uma2 family (restriction endonuclease fold) [Dyadobacter koreensis]|uniref:Endonuclease, Uma2 family (Restriction endonuclease fold) n=1 Tax=Dyadobacter koreensis TaxID=408657 RepID=A0A1H7BB11_9BACT|nr:Uma2 family endonuclease [Dyadobacter koreensis]SEJ71520.1 Endonuclease, Uma2 family (restriction endonuclease fold) [Dyadobacter koreensis]
MEFPLIIRPVAGLTEDMFFDLCQANEQLCMERDKDGNIIVMAPTGSDTGNYNFEFGLELGLWNRETKLGYVFDSSSGFTLPNGAVRSPDLSWISKSRWEALTEADRKKFAPICPDLVVEVRSLSDDISDLHDKMREYQLNGCLLGWLIDRINKKIHIYRQDGSVEVKVNIPVKLSGEDILPGLIVETRF